MRFGCNTASEGPKFLEIPKHFQPPPARFCRFVAFFARMQSLGYPNTRAEHREVARDRCHCRKSRQQTVCQRQISLEKAEWVDAIRSKVKRVVGRREER